MTTKPSLPKGYEPSAGPLENIFNYAVQSAFKPFFDFMQGFLNPLVQMLFGLDLVETKGPFVLGEPVAGDGGFFTGSTLSRIAAMGYERVWLAEGGEITIAALVLFTSLYVVRGMFDLFQYGARQQQRNNFFKGVVLMIVWFPLFLGFIRITHAAVLSFMQGGKAATSLMIGTLTYPLMANAIPVGGQILSIITFGPYVAVALIMKARDIILGVILIFGVFIIAAKYSNLPVISDAADKILRKTVPIVLLPLPFGPIWYLYENFLVAGPSGAIVGVSSVIFGIVFVMVFGFVLLFAVWAVFKLVAPSLAQAGGTIGKVAVAAGVVATGGGGAAAYSAMRGGPMAAGARMLGQKYADEGMDIGPWNRDGERGGDD
jgi:hypothetical protein